MIPEYNTLQTVLSIQQSSYQAIQDFQYHQDPLKVPPYSSGSINISSLPWIISILQEVMQALQIIQSKIVVQQGPSSPGAIPLENFQFSSNQQDTQLRQSGKQDRLPSCPLQLKNGLKKIVQVAQVQSSQADGYLFNLDDGPQQTFLGQSYKFAKRNPIILQEIDICSKKCEDQTSRRSSCNHNNNRFFLANNLNENTIEGVFNLNLSISSISSIYNNSNSMGQNSQPLDSLDISITGTNPHHKLEEALPKNIIGIPESRHSLPAEHQPTKISANPLQVKEHEQRKDCQEPLPKQQSEKQENEFSSGFFCFKQNIPRKGRNPSKGHNPKPVVLDR